MDTLNKVYNPKEAENKWYQVWEKEGFFHAEPNEGKSPFCIVIPPPNVTGILHMGHALNNTIQDILIRYHRMLGFEALWMPGTDHAGIATQNVVEKSIAKEGLKRQDLGRDAFLERVWHWKEQYGSTIIHQLKKLGASCDWSRTRFTMDEEYSKSVLEVFVSLYEKGLIYQGFYIIHWCPRCQTALSDEEAPHHELQGNLYYIKYPFLDSTDEFVTVATTRPETMLGDTAVAVNPKDKRYKKLIGKTLLLPLVNRKIKIIADEMVDAKFGTGAVKVTPAHDPNDYQMGKKHKLEFITIMHPDGRINERGGAYNGMDRFEAREVLLEDLREKQLLEKVVPHQLSAGHCYRCHTIIEPYLSKQWFVKMQPLAKPAIEAVKKGRVKFYPKRWTKVYLNWMENIQDWCISRQIWWGHRIPVFYCKDCQKAAQGSSIDAGVIVAKKQPDTCPTCGSADIYQDEDVLDTWFSSWLWPFATFYWPCGSDKLQVASNKSKQKKELDYFYPTSTLVTAPEIIFFWVARMIMSGLEFMKDIPFKDVYIHGTVRDIEGKKMSKSLGNVIDPLEIINEYGTDALRFSLISITAQGQDVYLSKERFEQGRNFANKIWNASRFVLMNLDQKMDAQGEIGSLLKAKDLNVINRWIISRFFTTLKEVEKNLNSYKFNEVANLLYGFFWHEFCDWYLELIKTDIKHPQNQLIMRGILEDFLKVLHPFMPFISEEIWEKINPSKGRIMQTAWPKAPALAVNKKTEAHIAFVFEVITAVRNMRAELEILPGTLIEVRLFMPDTETLEIFSSMEPHIKSLAKVGVLAFEKNYAHSRNEYVVIVRDMRVVIPLTGVIDLEKYSQSIRQRITKAESDIKAKQVMLSNQQFVLKAPKEIVEKEKDKLKELKETVTKLKEVLHGLQ